MISEEVKKKYNDVQTVLDDALNKAYSIEISGEEENTELSQIRETLKLLNADFKKEIERRIAIASCNNFDK